MAETVTQAMLDERAQQVADLLDELPWCECTGYLVVEEEEDEEPDPQLNQYLQAFDVLVFDGYVTDFVRFVRGLEETLPERFQSHETDIQLTVDLHSGEDPNNVPLSLMVHYHGPDEGYVEARSDLLNALHTLAARTVEEWSQDEEDEEPVETLV